MIQDAFSLSPKASWALCLEHLRCPDPTPSFTPWQLLSGISASLFLLDHDSSSLPVIGLIPSWSLTLLFKWWLSIASRVRLFLVSKPFEVSLTLSHAMSRMPLPTYFPPKPFAVIGHSLSSFTSWLRGASPGKPALLTPAVEWISLPLALLHLHLLWPFIVALCVIVRVHS